MRRIFAASITAGILLAVSFLRFGEAPAPLVAQPVATNRDWPMLGGTNRRNLVNLVERNIPTTWDKEKKENIRWMAQLGSDVINSPVIADGKVYIGTNNQRPRDAKDTEPEDNGGRRPIDMGVLMCFRESDGAFLWQHTHPKLAAGRVNDWPLKGLASTPVIEGNRLYYVSNRAELICADTSADGKIIWRLDMIKELGAFPHNASSCSPLIVEDWLFLLTGNGVDEGHVNIPAPLAPSFLKVEKRTGKVVWQDNSPTVKFKKLADRVEALKSFRDQVNRAEIVSHAQWASPAHAIVQGEHQVLWPGGDGWLYSFDLEGRPLWKFDGNPKESEYKLGATGTRNHFVAPPVIYKDRVYIAVGQDPEHEIGVGHLWCIDMNRRGDVSPELVTDASVFPPKTKANPNSALVWHYGGAVPKEERARMGRNYVFGRSLSTCAVANDLLVMTDLSGWVHCLDATTGKVHWTHDTDAFTWSSPFIVDGKIFVGNDDGVVTVFAHSKVKSILAENQMTGRIRRPFAVANGTLYFATENKLYAIAVPK